MELRDCVVLTGPELEPRRCARFAVAGGIVSSLEAGERVAALDDGALVVLPGLVNGHTHVGDSAFPDGATGLTLEQGFFRPDGFKYRELTRLGPDDHVAILTETLGSMARGGTIAHLDFREQGAEGARRLRAASAATGVRSIILGQFDSVPFDAASLEEASRPLPVAARAELSSILAVADGFSESTMNDLTDAAWREVAAMTEAAGRLRAIHCLENAGYRDLSLARTGRGDLERALELLRPHLVVHLTVADDAEIARLAAAGTPGVLNPRANAALGLPLPPVARLLESGVPLLLGTDNGLLNGVDLWAELDFTYKLAKSQFGDARRPDPVEILKMVTVNPARIAGAGLSGGLVEGGPADFIVVDFRRPHLRRTRHLVASLVSRVHPDDVLGAFRAGRALHLAPELEERFA